jgi:hypothetical protein
VSNAQLKERSSIVVTCVLWYPPKAVLSLIVAFFANLGD